MSALPAIKEHIQKEGPIRFSKFMEMALYHPEHGYYTSNLPKFGSAGDFITAPERSSLFSQCVANQCTEILDACGGHICEIGAGSGVMAGDILLHLADLDCLPTHYTIIEISPALQTRQRAHLKKVLPDRIFTRLQWLEALPKAFIGVVLANELLDALPVDRFLLDDSGLSLEYVDIKPETPSLCSIPQPAPTADQAAIDALPLADLQHPYHSEINLNLANWLSPFAKNLKQGVMLLIDYGHHRAQYYRPDRKTGTLMCHHNHLAHSDPFLAPGEQDITAHVDFTAVAETGYRLGLTPLGYTTQAFFLLDNGLLNLPLASDPKQADAIKSLTLPGEMGEAFKVFALGKNIEHPLQGFQTRNRLELL